MTYGVINNKNHCLRLNSQTSFQVFPPMLNALFNVILHTFLLLFQAMQVIRDNALSAAIFAPGWVYETQDEAHFTENQNK